MDADYTLDDESWREYDDDKRRRVVASAENPYGFTDADWALVDLLLQGHGPKKIVELTGQARSTVMNRLSKMYLKLDVRARPAAVVKLWKFRSRVPGVA